MYRCDFHFAYEKGSLLDFRSTLIGFWEARPPSTSNTVSNSASTPHNRFHKHLTFVAVAAAVKLAFLEEEPFELAGEVWAATDLLLVLFAPLVALAEWEKVNLKPPVEVLLGRFSLSSLSFANGARGKILKC